MKTEDFERLKKICEKEGFEIEMSCPWYLTYRISKKDPWDGVEFARLPLRDDWFDGYTHFKIKAFDDVYIHTSCDSKFFKSDLEPSTETAYVEQLKRIAKEKFGYIENGDKFDFTTIGYPEQEEIRKNNGFSEWHYSKAHDELRFFGYCLYKQGKWAERVKESVKVDYDSWTISQTRFVIHFEHNEKHITKFDRVPEFLCKQLENYLNDDPNQSNNS